MTSIKICGLRTPEDARAVNAASPEMAGFIFDPSRRRYIDPGRAGEIRKALLPGIVPVGVFVNASPEEVLDAVRRSGVEAVQLHGSESPEYILRLRERLQQAFPCREIRIIRAFRAECADDFVSAGECPADLILLDHGAGGTGERISWQGLEKQFRTLRRPFLLAGGLNEANVQGAIRLLHPFGVDVSSGVKTDGKKDPVKIRRFVSAVRNA